MERYLIENVGAWAKVGQVVPLLDSTNLELQRQVNASIKKGMVLPEGYSIRADFQSCGRGQLKRAWEGNPGENLAVSFLLSGAGLEANRLFTLSQNISLAVREVVEEVSKQENVTIKWPNDIYVGSSKIAGILIETSLNGSSISHLIVGIGINVNQLSFRDAPIATSIALLLGKQISVEALFDKMANKLQERHLLLSTISSDPYQINQQYHEALYGFGKRLLFRNVADGQTFYAQVLGVGAEGKLRLKVDGEERGFSLGDLVFMTKSEFFLS